MPPTSVPLFVEIGPKGSASQIGSVATQLRRDAISKKLSAECTSERMLFCRVVCSCTLSAITLRKLSEAHISVKSQTTIKYIIKLSASVTETIIFMYLGIAAVSSTRHWDTVFVILTLLFCLSYRAIGARTFLRVSYMFYERLNSFYLATDCKHVNNT